MTYTPRPGMVPVSVSPYPPARQPTHQCGTCGLTGLGKTTPRGQAAQLCTLSLCLGLLGAWACVCLVDACRFQVLSMRNQGITSCTGKNSGDRP